MEIGKKKYNEHEVAEDTQYTKSNNPFDTEQDDQTEQCTNTTSEQIMNPFECVEADGIDREISDEQDAADVKNDSEDDYNVYTDENIEEPEVYNDVNGPKEKEGLSINFFFGHS